MQSTVVCGCSLWNMDGPILFYFYHQHWISAGSRRSQCDEVFGEVAWEEGGSVHMSCFYSNCGPGAWISDYCLLTTFKHGSCGILSSTTEKLCMSASTVQCWGLDEASFHRDRLSFLCYSIFLLIGEASITFCAQTRCCRNTTISATSKSSSSHPKGNLTFLRPSLIS